MAREEIFDRQFFAAFKLDHFQTERIFTAFYEKAIF